MRLKGRVKESSVKNFQLAVAEAAEKTVLLFGKQSSTRFAMDVAHPLSLFQVTEMFALGPVTFCCRYWTATHVCEVYL